MKIAQSLYDQGLITYLRTDSPNIDDEGVADIAAYAQGAGLTLTDKPRKWKAKEGAQEGHEAIRPTHAANLDCGADDASAVSAYLAACRGVPARRRALCCARRAARR